MIARFSLILLSASVLSACSMLGGNGEGGLGSTRFYSLTPLALSDTTQTKASNPQLRIGVGPIGLSRLLRRPQIITRKSATEVAMAEKHQWGGILKEDLSRTLTDNFSGILGTENIEEYPWKLSFKPTYHVRIDIDQLDGKLGESVTLKARWRLMKGREEINVENSTITTKVTGPDYNAYVAAQSEALRQLTVLIAKQMR
ncbi:PqiC family protein [Leucothrix pacifica]|uniref:ABC-type transport auxiliary lipoprotein component domain-containing protein n=1 Tax=Leucothrix pacifica TaxID=1247513 RepID=A0A317C0F4_9GAMM|nr:PqiC family protein [Leucothrix pacifica]PWQ92144.1 hypothetical protein DKW60_22640 [Leucothrix pacifica]